MDGERRLRQVEEEGKGQDQAYLLHNKTNVLSKMLLPKRNYCTLHYTMLRNRRLIYFTNKQKAIRNTEVAVSQWNVCASPGKVHRLW